MSSLFGIGGGGNVGVSGFYPVTIDDSLRFDIASSTNLTRTAGTPTDGKKATWSWWMKKSDVVSDTSTSYRTIFYSGSPNSDGFGIAFMRYGGYHYHELVIKQDNGSSASHMFLSTNAFYRDVSGWYHFVVSYDSTDSTAADRIKIYVNGTQQTINTSGINVNPPLNHIPSFQVSGKTLRIGEGRTDSDEHIGGYLSDIHFIDGQALDPTSFGEEKDGVWIPSTYSGTYGDNGFHLEFDGDTTDSSGNGNDWTANNISAHDYVPDSPTNNFATLNAVDADSQASLVEGNLNFHASSYSNYSAPVRATQAISSGKWYWECLATVFSGSGNKSGVFLTASDKPAANDSAIEASGVTATEYAGTDFTMPANSMTFRSGGLSSTLADGTVLFSSYSAGDIVSMCFDYDTGKLWIGKNGTFYNSGDPASGSNPTTTITTSKTLRIMFDTLTNSSLSAREKVYVNFGQDSTFAGYTTAGGNQDANGIGDFKYAPPSGYLALCSANLPTPTIVDGSEHFNTVLYTGTGATNAITVGFAPDFVWAKRRSSAASHGLVDSVRGAGQTLFSNLTDAEDTGDSNLTSFDTNGFTAGTGGNFNASGQTYAAWNWKAGGTAVSNTDGSITSQVSANTDAGFSIVGYQGNGTAGATVGHGLGVTPDLLILRRRSPAEAWPVWVGGAGFSATEYLRLPTTNAKDTATTLFNSTLPSSSVVTLGNGNFVNTNASDYIMYAFANTDGYLKAGSYTGNGSSDGPMVFTGGRVQWLMVKRSDSTGNWYMWDDVRHLGNDVDNVLYADLSNAESVGSSYGVDFLSNGFKVRHSGTDINASGGTFIYLAIMETPLKFATAR